MQSGTLLTTSSEFVSDGCTGFFDVWRGVDLYPCCYAHDLAWYQHPGDWVVWAQSNIDLAICVARAGAPELFIPFLIVVSSIGALLFAGVLKRRNK